MRRFVQTRASSGEARATRMAKSGKRISIVDLAAELHLSTSTVSRALNNASDVSEATKAEVRALARKLNYQHNTLAASLRRGHSNLLGIIVPHINGAFFPAVVHGIERLASRAGYNVIICQSSEEAGREEAQVAALLQARVDGILVSISSTTRKLDHFEQVRQQGVPLVFFDRMPELANGCGVVADDHLGAFQITQHLLEQGCRRIVHLAGPQHLNIAANRLRGYQDAQQARGITPDPALVIPLANSRQEGGITAMRQLLASGVTFDAVFSAYDFAAAGAMQVLEEHGLRVPDDVALAGFSNEPFTTMVRPRLTSVDQRGELMGEAAVQLFQQLVKRSDVFTGQRIVLKPRLLIRESSLRQGPPSE